MGVSKTLQLDSASTSTCSMMLSAEKVILFMYSVSLANMRRVENAFESGSLLM